MGRRSRSRSPDRSDRRSRRRSRSRSPRDRSDRRRRFSDGPDDAMQQVTVGATLCIGLPDFAWFALPVGRHVHQCRRRCGAPLPTSMLAHHAGTAGSPHGAAAAAAAEAAARTAAAHATAGRAAIPANSPLNAACTCLIAAAQSLQGLLGHMLRRHSAAARQRCQTKSSARCMLGT